MKKIEAIIKPFKLDELSEALQDAGVGGITVTEVRGFGNQRGKVEKYGGDDNQMAELLPKIKMEMVVEDAQVKKIVGIIQNTANSGKNGDGKIFIMSVDEVVRIRTGEKGGEAL